MGHLILMIRVHNIPVSRHFSYATLLTMFGEVPSNEALMNPSVVSEELMFELERDFQYGWDNIWLYLSYLQTLYIAAKGVLEELKDVKDPIFYNLQNLDLTLYSIK